MLVRIQAGSEKAREPGYPRVLQIEKWLQHPKVLLPAQLVITPLVKAEEPLQMPTAQLLSFMSALHKPPSQENWGVIKSQKQFQHILTCLAITAAF